MKKKFNLVAFVWHVTVLERVIVVLPNAICERLMTLRNDKPCIILRTGIKVLNCF